MSEECSICGETSGVDDETGICEDCYAEKAYLNRDVEDAGDDDSEEDDSEEEWY